MILPSLQILIRNRATDLDARMHDGTTPLILAARLAVEGMLEDLISCHADVNAVDDLGTCGPPSLPCMVCQRGLRNGLLTVSPLPFPLQGSLPCIGLRP